MFPRNENRNEGTFAKTTLLRNRPFISPVIHKKGTTYFLKEGLLEGPQDCSVGGSMQGRFSEGVLL